MDKSHKTTTYHDWIRSKSGFILTPIVRIISRAGLTPNMMTALGFILNIGVAIVLSQGYFAAGGFLLLVASFFDALDGSLARLTHRSSRFGAFFDSTLDRYSEAVVYGGLLIYYTNQGTQTEPLLIYAAIIGSLMVSYTRARAEGLRIECKVGLATRVERILLTVAGLILGLVTPMLWLVAILANLTAVQRMLHIWRSTQTDD